MSIPCSSAAAIMSNSKPCISDSCPRAKSFCMDAVLSGSINVTLKEDSQVLAETVVIGYGSAKKRDLTGSITNVKGEEIANKPATNPLSSLQGKVAGVQIVNSGRAGADPEIRIRGTNSINGYKPLYVVDGLFNDNINFLNPEDIESMEINCCSI